MTATATARVTRARSIGAGRDRVWACVGDLDSITSLIDGFEEARPLDGGGHLFLLRPVHALGRGFRPGAKLQVTFTPPTHVRFEPVAESADAADAVGVVSLTADGPDRTHVQVAIEVSLQLPLPRLLAAPASGVLAHELRVGFDRFLDNLERALP